MKRSGWDLKIREALLVNPMLGYGGTLDILARDSDGRIVLADIKTGKGVYKESVLQLAAYGMAELIQPVDATTVAKMPKPDRYAILHVTATGVREIEVPISDDDRSAFLACHGPDPLGGLAEGEGAVKADRGTTEAGTDLTRRGEDSMTTPEDPLRAALEILANDSDEPATRLIARAALAAPPVEGGEEPERTRRSPRSLGTMVRDLCGLWPFRSPGP